MKRYFRSFVSPMAALAIFIFAGFAGFHRSQAAPCDPFQLLPIFASYPEDASGGSLSGSFGVWLGAGCTWLAATDASWIHITGGSSGTGNGPVLSGIVTYDVDSNTGGQARSAKIYVRAENTTAQYLEHTVFQDGWQYQPVAQILMPVINPTFGQGGTIIRVTGSGFGTDPDALAAGVLINPSTIVPLKTIQGGLPDLHLGVISQDIGAGGLISVTRGQGRTGFFKPAFADIVLREPAWIWTGNAESVTGNSEQPFTLRPTTPPPGTHWYFSGAPSNGALCVHVTGSWSPSNRVSIDLFAENPGLHLHRAARLRGIEFPGGTLLDCARRICDVLRCGFTQMGRVTVNCEVELGGAIAPVVKLTLSSPEGPFTRGGLMISVEPASPLPTPEITGFSPTAGGEGTPITIAGRNFGSNPHNLSATILNGACSIPLQVISASETQAVAVVGAVPPRALPGPIRLGLGDGDRSLVSFEHGDIQQPIVIGTLYETGPNATSRDSFTPQPEPRPPAWPQCYFSDPPSGGQVCLTISGAWPTPAKVSISAGLHDTRAGKGRDIQVDDVEFQSGAIVPGNPPIIDPLNILECAYRICDVIGSGSLQGGGFLVNCSVQLVSPGVAQICLSMVDGFVDQGHLNVCVQPADYVPASDDPTITDFFPKEGSPGDVIRIIGRNFLGGPDTTPNPDNIAVAVVNGAMTLPMQAVSISDSEILAVLDEVPPNAMPGPIRVSFGRGMFEQFISLPGVAGWWSSIQLPAGTPVQTLWSWSGGGPSVQSSANFDPKYRVPLDGATCYHSGAPSGILRVLLPTIGPWPSPAQVSIDFAGKSECVPVSVKIKESEFVGSGSAMNVAQRVSDVINSAFVANGLLPKCEAKFVNNPGGDVGWYVIVYDVYPVGASGCLADVSSGHLNVCVKPSSIFLPPDILEIFPSQARAGELVHVTGQGFGYNPKDLSLVLWNGSNSIPFEVLTANGTELTARLGTVPPGAQPGLLQLDFGGGTEGFHQPFFQFADVRQWQASRRWRGNGTFAMSSNLFTPLPSPPPTNGAAWYFSGAPANAPSDNGLYVFLPTTWPPNPKVRVSLRAFIPDRDTGLEILIGDLRFATSSADQYARRICDAIQAISRLEPDGLVAACGFAFPPGGLRLGVGVGLGRLTAGHLNVCIEPGPPPPVITGVNPREGREGDLIMIVGNNFIVDPIELEDRHLYGLASMAQSTLEGVGVTSIPLEILSVVSTQILARVGPVDPAAGPGPLVLSFGQGQQGFFAPSFPDVVPGSNVWTWHQTSISVTSAVPFTPRASAPTAGTQYYFSGPPTNGALCVTLRGDWPRPARVRIEARARNAALLLERDLRAVDVRFNGGGSTLDCSQRLCDVIRAAFRQQAGIHMNCAVVSSPAGDGSVKVTLTLPEGPIDSGHLTVCVGPEPTLPTPVIERFTPAHGGEGTLVTILGRNFLGGPDTLPIELGGPDTAPEDLSVVIREGNGAIPLEVLSATDTMIEARLGPVPPGSRGGPLVVATGLGKRGLAVPRTRGVTPLSPAWAWTSSGPSATSTASFTPQPGAATQTWFFSGPPTDGKLRVVVPVSAWTTDAVVRVNLRAQSSDQAIACDGGPIQLQDRVIAGLLQAASVDASIPIVGPIIAAIAAVIEVIGTLIGEAIGDATGGETTETAARNLNYAVSLQPGGSNVEVIVSMPTSPIDWGCFNLCIAPPAPPVPPVITDIQPRFGASGEIVHITGRGFGNNPDNLSIVVLNGAETIPLRALRATDTMIVARLGLVSPGAQAGPIRISKGVGVLVNLGSAVAPALQPTAGDASWIWHNSLNPSVLAGLQFQPFFNPCCEPNSLLFCKGFYSGPPVNGDLCVFIDDGGAFINLATIELHAFSQFANVTRDLEIPKYCWGPASSGASAIAQQFCNAIVGAFQQQGIVVNCWVQPAPDNKVKLVFSLPEGIITEGHIRICLRDGEVGCIQTEPVRPRLIQSSNPNELLLTWPRSLTGYQLEATDDLFGSPPGHVNWVPITLPLRATDTELQMTLPNGPGQPQLFFRLSKP